MKIKAKPHHILDIFKLYGAGYNTFTPDTTYRHNFHNIGNLILTNPNITIHFVLGSDDICSPCAFNKDNKCTDLVPNNPSQFDSKETWNRHIDQQLLSLFNLNEGDEMSALQYCHLALKHLNKENISTIWHQRPVKETQKRTSFLLSGLQKYSDTNG